MRKGRHFWKDNVARVIALMGSLDVKERGEAVVEGHLKEAREHLERLPLSKKGKELMDELIVYLARREK